MGIRGTRSVLQAGARARAIRPWKESTIDLTNPITEGVRKELRAKGSKVKISILCPGPVQTNFEKTANITFQFNGTDVNRVARYTLEHLDQFYILPSLPIRVSRVLVKALPTPVVTSAIYFLQSRRKK